MKRFTLDKTELKKWSKNLALFTAPALAVFFFQLSQGVDLKTAWPLAVFVLWGLLFDYFKKLK